MKITSGFRKYHALLFAAGLAGLLSVGCSGSDQDEEKLEATEATEEAPKEEEATPAEETPAEEPEEEAVVTPDPEPVAEIPATPAATTNTATDKSRVVRYVTQDGASIHGQPADTAESVGKLMKGDMILVVESNGWGKISDNMFIKLDALSNKAVPRSRTPAVWGKPAH